MAEFGFLVEDLMSGAIKCDLAIDLSQWSYDDTLCRPGSWQAGLPVASSLATEEILDPWRTAIYALRDGRVEWGGVLMPPQLSLGASELSLNAFGWLGYWDHRTIRTDYAPEDVDQFEIFERLVLDAQDEGEFGDGYDLGIAVDWDALSGVERTRSTDYLASKSKNLGEALRALAALEDGFDFAMTYALNTTTDRVDKAIKLFYPQKGRETTYLFEYEHGKKTNVIARGFADPVDLAWVGDGWGSGNDETRLRSPYVDETVRGVYPPYDGAPSWSSVTTQETLDEHTAAWFARRNRPKRVPVLRLDPDMFPKWGDWETGDTVGVRVTDGYGSTPGSVPQPNRIIGTKVSSDGNHDIVLAHGLDEATE